MRHLRSFHGHLQHAAILTVAALAAAGCSGQQRAAPVDPAKARAALEITLDAWKNGGKPEQLKTGSPPMTVQDLDWLSGFALLDYQIEGDGKDDDANLRVPVTLTLRTPQGKEVRKSVSYVVGTDPTLTVFRDFH